MMLWDVRVLPVPVLRVCAMRVQALRMPMLPRCSKCCVCAA